MISRLLDVIFVQLLRTRRRRPAGHGWLSGAIDSRINPAMSAIHADPGRAWSVSDLAELSNLSRSAFADRFQRVVGQAPLSYLTTWRLDRAAELCGTAARRFRILPVGLAVGSGVQSRVSRTVRDVADAVAEGECGVGLIAIPARQMSAVRHTDNRSRRKRRISSFQAEWRYSRVPLKMRLFGISVNDFVMHRIGFFVCRGYDALDLGGHCRPSTRCHGGGHAPYEPTSSRSPAARFPAIRACRSTRSRSEGACSTPSSSWAVTSIRCRRRRTSPPPKTGRQGCAGRKRVYGAFLLAETGLLDGVSVTTHWRYAAHCSALARQGRGRQYLYRGGPHLDVGGHRVRHRLGARLD